MNSISELGRMLRGGEVSCVDMTREYLDVALKKNAELGAYISITEETALNAAAQVDGKIKNGQELAPLAGMPLALKDNIVTTELITTCASRMMESYVSLYDASVWEYLKAQAAVLIGKSNMDEFEMGTTGETSYYGVAKNPLNAEYVAGGSSGGVAAAVAAGTAAFGIGSDTGGGLRQSASFCGLVGLKPTFGAVSRNGLVALASSFDQIGPITTTVRDAATVFDAISLRDERDAICKGSSPISASLSSDISGLKIGVVKEFYENLEPGIESSLQNALKAFEKLGAVLVELDFPLLRHSLSAYYIIACAEASSNLGCFDGLRSEYRTKNYRDIDDFICRTRAEGFGAEAQRRILLGTCVLSSEFYESYYSKASMLKNAIKNEFKRLLSDCDCLVTPTVPVTALKAGVERCKAEEYLIDKFTAPVSMAGLPAVSLPCGFDENGLPIGMQIIGNKFREGDILNAALAFENRG